MNWQLIIAVVVLVSVAGGIFGTLLLSRSIGTIVAKALRGECESQDIVSALRKVVILILLIIILPWSIIYATVGSMGDQYFRNIVNQLMGGPDLFRHLAIEENDYHNLPVYWKQALAEIALRPEEEAVDVQNIIKDLKLADIKIIDLLAPYATHIGILRDDNQLSEHPMPELLYSDFSHLENLGILEDVNNGRTYDITKVLSSDSNFPLLGTSVILRFKANDPTIKFVIKTTAFTSGGKQLIEALQVPSNITYFEWFAETLEEKGFTVELLAMGVKKSSMSEAKEIQARIERHSIPAWTR